MTRQKGLQDVILRSAVYSQAPFNRQFSRSQRRCSTLYLFIPLSQGFLMNCLIDTDIKPLCLPWGLDVAQGTGTHSSWVLP